MSRHLATKDLSAYLDAEVARSEVGRIDRHLEECAECRERLEGLRRVVGGLRSLESVSPPRRLGLELQSQLARATPPFGDRSPLGRHSSRRMLQPVVLASLAVVLALAVIMLLFLQALQGRQSGPPADGIVSSPEFVGEADAIIGGRAYRRTSTGWVESSLSVDERAGARVMRRTEVMSDDLPADLRTVFRQLSGELTIRLDGEVVRLTDE